MRIAALSDIHGNLLALDAVLAHVAGQEVDLTVNLGDLLSGGLAPKETADRLMALNLPTVRGNHERQVLSLPYERMSLSDRLARDTMTAAHLAWFETLPLTLVPADGVLAFHGAPADDRTYLLDTVGPTGARAATENEVQQRLDTETGWSLMLCGHTHLQRRMRLPSGLMIVNPGSVGWPAYSDDHPHPHVMEAGTPHARYSIVDDASGEWEVEDHAVTYDWDAAARIAMGNARPDIARALTTGRV